MPFDLRYGLPKRVACRCASRICGVRVGAPTLTPAIRESQRQATLLGSPYRKSEDKKKSKR